MKKNKKIIIIIVTIILIIGISIVTYLHFSKNNDKDYIDIENNKEENVLSKEEPENIEFTYTEDGPGFVCSNKILYSNNDSYDKGEFVYCEIAYEMPSNKPGIKEIWFENTHDEDIEYIEVADIFEEWSLTSDAGVMHLTSDRATTYGDGLYKVKFRIIPSTKEEKLEILFKNIKYKDTEDNYYQTDDAKIELKINKATNYKFESSEKYDSISFYKFNQNKGYELINKYECKDESCHILVAQCFSYTDLENGMTFIHDNNTTLMYDFNKGIIGEYAEPIYSLYNSNEQKYFVVKDINTKKTGIIDIKGNIVKELTSDSYGVNQLCELNRQSYSIKNDMITEKKDGKYGIVKITKNDVVVDYQYDDIRLYSDKYYKAKIDDKWYLYSFDTQEKVHEQGYQELFIVTNEVIVAKLEDYLYIKDYNGNDLTDENIKTYMDYNEEACCGTLPGISVQYDEENNKIKIFITTEPDENYKYEEYQYSYDIKNKKLTQVK